MCQGGTGERVSCLPPSCQDQKTFSRLRKSREKLFREKGLFAEATAFVLTVCRETDCGKATKLASELCYAESKL